MKRALALFLALSCVLSISAKTVEKGKFILFQNGINKGYDKYKIETKRGKKKISSEIRFHLPMPKAKRGYVDLYLYPELTTSLENGDFLLYKFRLLYDDFTDKEMTEAEQSATEIIDQDFRNYSLFNRSAQRQEDVMANRVDLGVNSGKLVPEGRVLHFEQTRFSASRVKNEELPEHLTVLDSYAFALYIPLVEKALSMKKNSMPLIVAMPQEMGLRKGTLEYMGTDATSVGGEKVILKHFDVRIGRALLSSLWVDKQGVLIQTVVPSLGLVARRDGYTPVGFEHEIPRIFRETIAGGAAFKERRVHIPSGAIEIGATLTLPAGSGPFPTVLMVQDLEPRDRDGNNPDDPYSRAGTWKQLAYVLASRGFATLRFDRRGIGETGGEVAKATAADLEGDAVAMAAWLAKQPTTKPGGVELLAQGLGGWVASGAAARIDCRGMAALSYPAKGMLRLWKEQVSGIVDPQKRQKAYLDLESLENALSTGSQGYVPFRGTKVYLPGVRTLAAFDPLAAASSLHVPCLFLYPAKDRLVLSFHEDILKPALHEGQKTVRLEGLGHYLTETNPGGGGGGIVSDKALDPLIQWMKDRFAGNG